MFIFPKLSFRSTEVLPGVHTRVGEFSIPYQLVPKNPPTPLKQSTSLPYGSNGSRVFMDIPNH
jgi:hypothetical protein